MYLISAYFDRSTTEQLQKLIDEIAKQTGNHFMTDNHVPPHMTISSIEARSGEELMESFKLATGQIESGKIMIPTIGMFLPYVMYSSVVLNEYLVDVQNKVYDSVKDIPDTSVSKFYKPFSWLPHITLGKTLDEEQMKIAFEIVQKKFRPMEGTIVEMGLARTNPHEDILRIKL